ncbi:GPW/gp25 family protein [Bradyrhizobium sp. HKCCYLS20291]|uniref:GPW/gp25 family protein n=1 Tax=Bradyrhizobium sp. HKCCYLS20291 TaxID=3420766 RepID=UPI003EB8C814
MAALPSEHLVDIDRETGELIQGWPRIKQSIFVILTTRLKVRLMRLWWGSTFQNMQDKPSNEETMMSGMMAAIAAINTYEPEFKVTRVSIDEADASGAITITIDGIDLVEQVLRRTSVTI